MDPGLLKEFETSTWNTLIQMSGLFHGKGIKSDIVKSSLSLYNVSLLSSVPLKCIEEWLRLLVLLMLLLIGDRNSQGTLWTWSCTLVDLAVVGHLVGHLNSSTFFSACPVDSGLDVFNEI